MKPDSPTASHEAAHAVAPFLLGLEIKKVEVWGAEGLAKMGGRPSERAFVHVVALLAGGEYLRAIGIASGDGNDFARAAFLVEMAVDGRRDAAREAFAVVAEAAHELVRTDRFQTLVAVLTPELAKQSWHFGPEGPAVPRRPRPRSRNSQRDPRAPQRRAPSTLVLGRVR